MFDELLMSSHPARRAFLNRERERLEQLVRDGQAPHTLFIGCSDSRVVAESLTGARPGDLFVVRVVANIVPPYGSGQHGIQAAVEFALDALRVPRIVICGHTECGGVGAVDSGHFAPDSGLGAWLSHARLARDRIEGRNLTGSDRRRALTEENVRLQLEHLRTYPAVTSAVEEGRVSLHGWVFDLNRLEMRWCDKTGAFHDFDANAAPG